MINGPLRIFLQLELEFFGVLLFLVDFDAGIVKADVSVAGLWPVLVCVIT